MVSEPVEKANLEDTIEETKEESIKENEEITRSSGTEIEEKHQTKQQIKNETQIEENKEDTTEENKEDTTECIELPGLGAFPWEIEDWSPGCGSTQPRIINANLLNGCLTTEIKEYITEIQWLREQKEYIQKNLGLIRRTEQASLIDSVDLEKLRPSVPSATFLYKSVYRKKRPCPQSSNEEPPAKRIPNAIVLVPGDPLQSTVSPQLSISCSSSFLALLPNTFRDVIRDGSLNPDSKVLLGASRRLRRRYGDLSSVPQNPNLILKPCNIDDSNLDSFVINPDLPAPSSLLLDPMLPLHLNHLLHYHLQSLSSHGGTASPASPQLPMVDIPQSMSQSTPGMPQMNGMQPSNPRRNRSNLCLIHHHEEEQSKTGSLDGWVWNKSEPLSMPGLCSCSDNQLYELWLTELAIHRTECFKNKIPDYDGGHQSVPDLSLVDWDSVKEGKFDSFLNDLQKETKEENAFCKLRFCPGCGGLTYIPYSFIEISLNRDFMTLAEFVKKLPLPVPTDMFCDGLRITVTHVARSPLHEWIILSCLQFAQLEKTCRVYNVCPILIYPFHRLPDRWLSCQPHQLLDDVSVSSSSQFPPLHILSRKPCSRHHLLHITPPSKWHPMDSPPRFAFTQNRRPYCLSLRSRLEFPVKQDRSVVSPSGVTFSLLESLCWDWLKVQTDGQISTGISTGILHQQKPTARDASSSASSSASGDSCVRQNQLHHQSLSGVSTESPYSSIPGKQKKSRIETDSRK